MTRFSAIARISPIHFAGHCGMAFVAAAWIVGCQDRHAQRPTTLKAFPFPITTNDLGGPPVPSLSALQGKWRLRQGKVELDLVFADNYFQDTNYLPVRLSYDNLNGSGFCTFYATLDADEKRISLHHQQGGIGDALYERAGGKIVLPPPGTAELISDNMIKLAGNINFEPGGYVAIDAVFVKEPTKDGVENK